MIQSDCDDDDEVVRYRKTKKKWFLVLGFELAAFYKICVQVLFAVSGSDIQGLLGLAVVSFPLKERKQEKKTKQKTRIHFNNNSEPT